MPYIYTPEGKRLSVSREKISEAFSQGKTLDVPSGSKINAFDKFGKLTGVDFDPSNVAQAESEGYSWETRQQADHREDLKQYDDSFGDVAAAAALGLVSGITFGASEWVLTKTGLVEPETLKGYQEAQPIASGVGEFVGAVGPIVATGGGAALAKGGGTAAKVLSNAPTALVSRGAAAVEKGIASTLGGGALAKGVGRAAGGALEGGLYGAGHGISEAVINEEPITAEKMMGHIGMGALLGGAVNVGIPALAGGAYKATGKLLGKGKGALEKLAATKKGAAQSAEGISVSDALAGAVGFGLGGYGGMIGTSALATGIKKAIKRPDAILKAMSKAEMVWNKVADNKVAKIIGSGARRSITPAAVKLSGVGDTEEKPQPPKRLFDPNNQEAFEEIRSRLESLQSPSVLSREISGRLSVVADALPTTATYASLTMTRAIKHAMDTVPRSRAKSPLDVVKDEPPKIPSADLARWYDRIETIVQPASVLDKVASGTLTHEAAEALREVYPELLGDMAQRIISQATQSEAKLSYQTKAQIKMLTGIELDYSLNPAITQQLMLMGSTPSGQLQPQPPQKSGKTRKLSQTAKREITQSQTDQVTALEMREI